MTIEKKFDLLEKEILRILKRMKELYRQNIELKERIKLLEERERHLLVEVDRLRKNPLSSEIKKRLIKISSMIEKELGR